MFEVKELSILKLILVDIKNNPFLDAEGNNPLVDVEDNSFFDFKGNPLVNVKDYPVFYVKGNSCRPLR